MRLRRISVVGLAILMVLLMVVAFSIRTKLSSSISSFIVFPSFIQHDKSLQPETTVTPTRKPEKCLIVFWSTYFGSTVECSGSTPHKLCNNTKLRYCKIPCEITSDRNKAGNATALIVHTRDPSPLPPEKYKHIPLILFGVENPVYTPTLYDKDFLANFNYLWSYNLDRTDFYVPSFDKPSVKPPPLKFSEKTGLVLAVFSHCEKGRTAYLKELMNYIQVDSYGGCLRNKEGLIARSSSVAAEVAKIELARRYKFTLVFFNQDCDYFVDDQLTHALNAGSIPVYMGTDKVDNLLVGNLRDSIIKVKDFESPKKLAEYLKFLSYNEALYNRYLRWKYEGIQFPSNFSNSKHGAAWARDELHPYPDYCVICEALADDKLKGKPIKPAGLIKQEYCTARQVTDWLKR